MQTRKALRIQTAPLCIFIHKYTVVVVVVVFSSVADSCWLEHAGIEASQAAKSKFKSYEDDSHNAMIS